MNTLIKSHAKGALFALVTTLSAVLIFALCVKFIGLPGDAIKPTVQVIKVISIFIGVLVAVKTVEKRAWMHGAVLGLVYTVLAFLIFSVIDNNFSITGGLLAETLLAVIVGMMSAMLIRFRKKEF